MTLTSKVEKAISTAANAHRKQIRKGSGVPYIIHPFSVMLLASEVTDDEDTLVACLFHDILEDVPDMYSEKQMQQDYGENVVRIVRGVTKDDSIKDWHQRSEAYLTHLRNEAPEESVIVSLADKCHNLHAVLQDYDRIGDDIWDIFSSNKQSQLWWYQSILQVAHDRLPKNSLHQRLEHMIDKLNVIIAQ